MLALHRTNRYDVWTVVTETGASHPASFDEFVSVRGAAFVRFGYLLTHDREVAQDLAQEALGRLYVHWSRVRRSGSPEAYVRRSMLNLLLSWRRRRSWYETPIGQLPESAVQPSAAAGAAERDEVWQLLAQLPGRQRAVLVLRFYEDLPDEEIADLLGCTTATVRSHASKGLARLREKTSSQRQGVLP